MLVTLAIFLGLSFLALGIQFVCYLQYLEAKPTFRAEYALT